MKCYFYKNKNAAIQATSYIAYIQQNWNMPLVFIWYLNQQKYTEIY